MLKVVFFVDFDFLQPYELARSFILIEGNPSYSLVFLGMDVCVVLRHETLLLFCFRVSLFVSHLFLKF